MEDEWEEEEQLVVVELSGLINSDFLTKCQGQLKVVGINTEQPMIQVGNYVFAGEYEDALGTCVIFEENRGCDGDAESSPKLEYKCHTVKKLMMQRTFLTEKKEGDPSSEGIEYLQLNDGDVRHRNFICNHVQDPTVMAASGEGWLRGGLEIGNRSPMSQTESDAEASDAEQAEQTHEGTEMDLEPGSSVFQETADSLDSAS
ncbi:hypothetical protein SKAU_G00043410 [Synaphobranchus kaupii]|uniref:General transcription factor 3C polypeptide 6 n=1 Tax=Synaphobranchus kaupii TaxID=118154 RepID=A0A9Q1G2D9_SYNKA|nr:hypothetical protein SKAU_G00043410 [Synaphobranchus kaupii]